jgi:hypothetical protein
MLRRLAVVFVSAAVAVPLLSGTASASCRTDLQNKNLEEGYTAPTYSPHWHGGHYVHVTGTATVLVEGDALKSDVDTTVTDWTTWTTIVAGNAAEGATEFVDCVAG